MLIVSPRVRIPLEEFEFTYARSSGPGGQNVNKVSSKAVLRWPVLTSPSLPDDVRARFVAQYRTRITTEGDLVLSSERYRDRPRNVQDCLDRLHALLTAVLHPPKRRRATKPTRGSQLRRVEAKRSRSTRKQQRRRPELD